MRINIGKRWIDITFYNWASKKYFFTWLKDGLMIEYLKFSLIFKYKLND